MNLVQDKYVQIPEKKSYLRENAGECLCFERAGHGDQADRMNGLQKSPRVDHPCQAVHPSGGQDALRTQGGPSPLSFLRNAVYLTPRKPALSTHTEKQVHTGEPIVWSVQGRGRLGTASGAAS